MSENTGEEQHIVIVGPDGQPVGSIPADALAAAQQEVEDADSAGPGGLADLVEQPAKVMRIGSMIRQLLEEVKAAPLDEASRNRLKEIHQSSIKELEQGLAPELVQELERLSLPFAEGTPSDSELRIAQAQLVGWLEGLFHGIQTAIYAQQVASRAQLEQMRRALPRRWPPARNRHSRASSLPAWPGQDRYRPAAILRPAACTSERSSLTVAARRSARAAPQEGADPEDHQPDQHHHDRHGDRLHHARRLGVVEHRRGRGDLGLLC
ncbi:bacterial proteasome activator family protein [Nocardioides alcanivorans]|uniref:bacterial proteasome activator family protein n=1 Tax=Nocardioides alcanivorans TaxID=2897352 RepID=UPI0028A2B3AC|nr:bacterial proteasome activator family protein [Nocardioides alcanivorans]